MHNYKWQVGKLHLVKLETADRHIFLLDHKLALRFGTIRAILGNFVDPHEVLPLPNVYAKHFLRILKWIHQHEHVPEGEFIDSDRQFLQMSDQRLYKIFMTASYLDIKELLDLVSNALLMNHVRKPQKKTKLRKAKRIIEISAI